MRLWSASAPYTEVNPSQPARSHIWRTLTRFSHAAQAPALRVGVGMQRYGSMLHFKEMVISVAR